MKFSLLSPFVRKGLFFSLFMFCFLIFSHSVLADGITGGRVNGKTGDEVVDGVTITPADIDRDDSGEPLREFIGSDREDGFYVDFDFEGEGEFKVVTAGACNLLEGINIKVTDTVSGRVRVEQLDENPTEVALENNIGFCQVEFLDFNLELVDGVEWKLTANRELLNEREIDKSTMSLMMFEENNWVELVTNEAGGDTVSFKYIAEGGSVNQSEYISLSSIDKGMSTARITYVILGIVGILALIFLGYIFSGNPKDNTSV